MKNKSDNTILLIGALTIEGLAVVKALLQTRFKIKVLVGNFENSKNSWFTEQGIEIVKANLEGPKSLLNIMTNTYGIYYVFPFTGDLNLEIQIGKNVADAAKNCGVKHFIYNSIACSEIRYSVEEFDTKWEIEKYIKKLSIPATIIKPVVLMENFANPFPSMMIDFLKSQLKEKKIQLIASKDIGKWVELAFSNPGDYIGDQFEIAGDELNFKEIQLIYRNNNLEIGNYKVTKPAFIKNCTKQLIYWLSTNGFEADIDECLLAIPNTLTFEKWLISQNRITA